MKGTILGLFFITTLCLISGGVYGQERGKFNKNPKIKQGKTSNTNNPNFPTEEKEPESEFQVETSNLQFQSQFEPVKPLNPVVSEDTSTIEEGEITVEEVVDSMQVGDDMVKVADYFVIWDTETINPYNLNPTEFNETVDLTLYDPSKNTFWNNPLDKVRVTSQFKFRWGRWHTGTDLDLDIGDTVRTTFDGMVRVVGWDGRGYGRFVVVRHYNGLETLYGHLTKNQVFVESGQVVKAGQPLAMGGNTGRSTGPHLHFENRYEGNPFDPRYIFDWDKQQIKSEHFVLTSEVWDFRRGGQSYKNELEDEEKPAYTQTLLHRVRSGETLYSIASKYGLSISALAKKNRISTRSTLRVGQKLRVK